jgi:hypothetical protein
MFFDIETTHYCLFIGVDGILIGDGINSEERKNYMYLIKWNTRRLNV